MNDITYSCSDCKEDLNGFFEIGADGVRRPSEVLTQARLDMLERALNNHILTRTRPGGIRTRYAAIRCSVCIKVYMDMKQKYLGEPLAVQIQT